MPNLIDFMERATSGPIVVEEDFNLKRLIPNTRKIVKEFNLEYDPDNLVPSDDDLADRLFEAAIEFAVSTGVYCDDTNRVIEFEREEIINALRNLPGGAHFGEGRERRKFVPRKPDDSRSPWCHVGTGIVASSEDIALAQVEGYGRIPQANSISIPAFNRIREMQVIGGSPLEIHAAVRAVQAGRKALTNAGRPGLPIMNLISSATTSVGTIAGSHPAFSLRHSDGWLIDFLAEMKVNFETLNRLAFVQLTGGNVGATALPILGGFSGGPAGTALVMTAYYLLGVLLFQGTYQLTCPVHFRFGCTTTRDCLWVLSVVGRATSRNVNFPDIALGYAAAGPQTKMYFYEAAAFVISSVASGYGGVQTVHPAKAVMEDGVTPLEAQFCAELTHNISSTKADRANELVKLLLEKYEDQVAIAPQGKRYQECYDLISGKPADEYRKLFEEVKDELVGLGIPMQ
jgi:hypothetical protein